jgi:hypothetical protein
MLEPGTSTYHQRRLLWCGSELAEGVLRLHRSSSLEDLVLAGKATAFASGCDIYFESGWILCCGQWLVGSNAADSDFDDCGQCVPIACLEKSRTQSLSAPDARRGQLKRGRCSPAKVEVFGDRHAVQISQKMRAAAFWTMHLADNGALGSSFQRG